MKQDGRRVTRRGIQVALGPLWILDGCLQFQPAMFTRHFATQVIAPAAQGQPPFVAWPVHEAARIIGYQPTLTDLSFGVYRDKEARPGISGRPGGRRWRGPHSGSAEPCFRCCREKTPMLPSAWP